MNAARPRHKAGGEQVSRLPNRTTDSQGSAPVLLATDNCLVVVPNPAGFVDQRVLRVIRAARRAGVRLGFLIATTGELIDGTRVVIRALRPPSDDCGWVRLLPAPGDPAPVQPWPLPPRRLLPRSGIVGVFDEEAR